VAHDTRQLEVQRLRVDASALTEESLAVTKPITALTEASAAFLPTCMPGGLYQKRAAYSNIGRLDIGLPWEVSDKATLLQEHKKQTSPLGEEGVC
jgi:hypothetical protein